jgi:hypothetical protein
MARLLHLMTAGFFILLITSSFSFATTITCKNLTVSIPKWWPDPQTVYAWQPRTQTHTFSKDLKTVTFAELSDSGQGQILSLNGDKISWAYLNIQPQGRALCDWCPGGPVNIRYNYNIKTKRLNGILDGQTIDPDQKLTTFGTCTSDN